MWKGQAECVHRKLRIRAAQHAPREPTEHEHERAQTGQGHMVHPFSRQPTQDALKEEAVHGQRREATTRARGGIEPSPLPVPEASASEGSAPLSGELVASLSASKENSSLMAELSCSRDSVSEPRSSAAWRSRMVGW